MATAKDVVCAEMAETEFQRFADAMDLDLDAPKDGEAANNFQEAKRVFLRELCAGRLTVNDKGEASYACVRCEKTVTFHRKTGATLLACDQAKEGQEVRKMALMIGEMTREGPGFCSNLEGRDLNVIMKIGSLIVG